MRDYIIPLPIDVSIVNYRSRLCDADECVVDSEDFRQSSVGYVGYRVYCARIYMLDMISSLFKKMNQEYESVGEEVDRYFKIFTVDVESTITVPGDEELKKLESLEPGVRSISVPYSYYFRITTTVDIDDEVLEYIKSKLNDYISGNMGMYLPVKASSQLMEKLIIFNYHLSQPYVQEYDSLITSGIQANRAGFNTTFLQTTTNRLIDWKFEGMSMYINLSAANNYTEIYDYLTSL